MVLLVAVGFLLLYRFRHVAVIIFSGIVISIAIAPSVDWLNKRGVPRSLSVIFIYLVLLILIIGFFVVLVPPIIRQIGATIPKIETYYQDLKRPWGIPRCWRSNKSPRSCPHLSLTPSLGVAASAVGSLDAVGQILNASGSV